MAAEKKAEDYKVAGTAPQSPSDKQRERQAALGIEQYVRELEEQGYCVVPPQRTGVTADQLEELTRVLLDRCEELVGCAWSVEDGPAEEIEFKVPGTDHEWPGTLEMLHASRQEGGGVKPAQFQLMQLCKHHRVFRDLAVNPVASELILSMIPDAKFSSHNCFVKWRGDGCEYT